VRRDGVIERVGGPDSIPPEDDLVVRAARALQAATGTPLGAGIAVEKRIPIGAGLGGGSSDAATVLVALNALWGTGLTRMRLAEIGLGLGADVPVFVHGRSAWAEGVGEKLVALELPPRWYVILDPRVHVSTAELFQASELTRNAAPATIDGFTSGAIRDNGFEPVLRARYREVASALDWLGRFGEARVSGSGGAVFLECEDEASARGIAARCPAECTAHVAEGVNVSPLEQRLNEYLPDVVRAG
jgi:4-diphosphocytidyl-2-C-methyl-D-erythritol kinase